jgi:hypothetical protein
MSALCGVNRGNLLIYKSKLKENEKLLAISSDWTLENTSAEVIWQPGMIAVGQMDILELSEKWSQNECFTAAYMNSPKVYSH